MKTVTIQQIDLRYESFRLKDRHREKALLSSVLEKGVLEPVSGIHEHETVETVILLDGFKRYRCAKKLGIQSIPYLEIGSDEASGILHLIRLSNVKSLNLLEQAKWVDELHRTYRLNIAEIAERVERSKSWVCVRLGILKEMSPYIQKEVFSGRFPATSYLYTLRQFKRLNGITKEDERQFVGAVSGKKLSIRDIELLGRGFFQGNQNLRDQIQKGNIAWSIKQLKELVTSNGTGSVNLSDFERGFIRDLEIAQKYMNRVRHKSWDSRLQSHAVIAEGNLLSGGILRQLKEFTEAVQGFYDRSRQT